MNKNSLLFIATLLALTACGSGSGGSANTPPPVMTPVAPSAPTPTTPTTPATPTTPTPPTPSVPPTPQMQVAVTGIDGVAFTNMLGASQATITIGQGVLRGNYGNQPIYEDLLDWDAASCKGLDPEGDTRGFSDGLNSSRDIVAAYLAEDAQNLYFRLDLQDLAFGAETTGLDLLLLIDWAQGGQSQLPQLTDTTARPYELAVQVLDTQGFQVLDSNQSVISDPSTNPSLYLGASFRADLDAAEFGISKAALRAAGWNGRDALSFQFATTADGEARVADAFLEVDHRDRVLDQHFEASWNSGRIAFASVVVGNRAVLPTENWKEMIRGGSSGRGTQASLYRTLETHQVLGTPINIHLSGAFVAGINWAADSDVSRDGPAFLARLRQFFDGDLANGEGAFIPGSFSDHMLPYFENDLAAGANAEMMRLSNDYLRKVLGLRTGSVVWTPERVIRGRSFRDLLLDENGAATGFKYTVLDQLTHIGDWFGSAEIYDASKNAKINRINDVSCFLVNDGASDLLLQPQDGGANKVLRSLLHVRAGAEDQQQVIVTVHDWEVASGNKNPEQADAWFDSQRWLASHPWVEVVSLEDLATRNWSQVERGNDSSLPTVSNNWLHHATQENYDNWYYGHPLEESFASLRPEVQNGQTTSLMMGDAGTRGTIIGESWFAARQAPGELGELARMVFAAALYRTAWHQEDMHDLSRDTAGRYVTPDRTRDAMIGFAYGLQSHIGDAAVVARAARWAADANLGPDTQAVNEDIDLDGQLEPILYNDRLFAVFETMGGRLESLFVRDPMTGEGHLVIGSPLSFPGNRQALELEGDTNQTAQRNSMLKDWWLSNPGTNRYVNEDTIAQITTATGTTAIEFSTQDGQIRKTVSLVGGDLKVHYEVSPSAGRLYLRGSLAPALSHLVVSGQAALQTQDDGQVFRAWTAAGANEVEVQIDYAGPGQTAQYNAQASDGTSSSPRGVSFAHMIELSGEGSFDFVIRALVR